MAENIQSNETEKRGPGQPPAKIDWKRVDDLLIAGCSGREIASNIGLSPDTLYLRCVTDNGVQFSEYSRQKSEKGESLLRAHQYAKALGLTDKGDNTLLIWLGKTRLKQRETDEQVVSTEVNQKYEALMDLMAKNQERKSEDTSKSTESKS